ncbi:hypothetical protein AHAS_Ahas19G0220300 [Arachis hypogaea]
MPLYNQLIPYLETTDLYHLARLNSYWIKLDVPLVSAFVDSWSPEICTFHMSLGECIVPSHYKTWSTGWVCVYMVRQVVGALYTFYNSFQMEIQHGNEIITCLCCIL